jgi:hypothetical protein
MAKTLNIIQGVVKYAAGPARETKNGPRINVVITLPSGEDIKLWGDPGDAVLTPLRFVDRGLVEGDESVCSLAIALFKEVVH